jgi:hypothetical protein
MGGRLIVTLGLIYLGFSVLGIGAAVSIVRKAGYSGWWVLAGFVPLANVVMVFAFAFADWPVLQDLRRTQRVHAAEPKGHPSFSPAPTPQPALGYPAAGYPPAEQPRPYGA